MKLKTYLIALLLICGIYGAKAQVTDTVKTDTSRFLPVDQLPEVVGGISKLIIYQQKNLRYPEEAKRNKIQGRVIVAFVVERDGSLSNVKIKRSLSADTDAEAIRLITAPEAPKWTPGMQGNKPVRVQFSIPVSFKLDE